jgi:hypothetical protein
MKYLSNYSSFVSSFELSTYVLTYRPRVPADASTNIFLCVSSILVDFSRISNNTRIDKASEHGYIPRDMDSDTKLPFPIFPFPRLVYRRCFCLHLHNPILLAPFPGIEKKYGYKLFCMMRFCMMHLKNENILTLN